jgi:hypothetical protein
MHRFSKRWYCRSSKRNARKEVARHERKAAYIRVIHRNINRTNRKQSKITEEQKLAARTPNIHHYIGVNENVPVSLLDFAQGADPGIEQDPIFKVRRHLILQFATS